MKTILFIAVVTLLFSCKTVHKASEDQYADVAKKLIASGNSTEKQSQATTEIQTTNKGIVSSSDNGYERLIEEMVLEYSVPARDSIPAGALDNKVVKTTRKIRERGTSKDVSVAQSSQRTGIRKFWNWLTDDEYTTANIEDLSMTQRKRLVERTGIPWYVWAGGTFSVSLVIWLKKKYQLNRSRYEAPQNPEP